MSEQVTPIGEIIEAWTEAEQDTWRAWSGVQQDLSQPESASRCAHALDAMETWARDAARLQSALLRIGCQQMGANPFVPPPARMVFAQACDALASASDMQHHLLVGWFGMARHMADRGR